MLRLTQRSITGSYWLRLNFRKHRFPIRVYVFWVSVSSSHLANCSTPGGTGEEKWREEDENEKNADLHGKVSKCPKNDLAVVAWWRRSWTASRHPGLPVSTKEQKWKVKKNCICDPIRMRSFLPNAATHRHTNLTPKDVIPTSPKVDTDLAVRFQSAFGSCYSTFFTPSSHNVSWNARKSSLASSFVGLIQSTIASSFRVVHAFLILRKWENSWPI